MENISLREWMRQAIQTANMADYATYNDVITLAMRKFNKQRQNVQDAYNKLKGSPGYVPGKRRNHINRVNATVTDPTPEGPRALHTINALSVEDLRMKHDTRTILRRKLAEIPRNVIYKEADMIDWAGLRGQPFRQHLDRSEFDKYRGRAGGVVYYGHPDDVQQLKNEMVLT